MAFKDSCNRMDTNAMCSSPGEPQSKLAGWLKRRQLFLKRLASLETTKCRFLRHSHEPDEAAERSNCIATSCCPPPIANSSYKPCPIVFIAYSASSLLASARRRDEQNRIPSRAFCVNVSHTHGRRTDIFHPQ